jgi:Asp/Glu/hydantoin racemase
MAKPPRIVLLHATTIAIPPIRDAFERDWPEAETVNLLDDALTLDRAREEMLSDALIDRFVAFGRYGHRIGADGILVTCSAFGPAIERLAAILPVPVVKPNDSMFEAALDHGPRVVMLATFAPSIPTMEEEFRQVAARIMPAARMDTILVDDAIGRLRSGDVEGHNRLVADAAGRISGADVLMLAHFSTSVAAEAASAATPIPVLTAPASAVARMRRLVGA